MQDKFCKARSVPYALRKVVDEEYDRLESEGIIGKVKYSDWAPPMVHIPKRDGTTRLCGDYAVTVIPHSASLNILSLCPKMSSARWLEDSATPGWI